MEGKSNKSDDKSNWKTVFYGFYLSGIKFWGHYQEFLDCFSLLKTYSVHNFNLSKKLFFFSAQVFFVVQKVVFFWTNFFLSLELFLSFVQSFFVIMKLLFAHVPENKLGKRVTVLSSKSLGIRGLTPKDGTPTLYSSPLTLTPNL